MSTIKPYNPFNVKEPAKPTKPAKKKRRKKRRVKPTFKLHRLTLEERSQPNSAGKLPGHVYCVQMNSTLYKIGFSRQMDKRLRALTRLSAAMCNFKLKVVIIREVYYPRAVEVKLHQKFKSQRLDLEFFVLDALELDDLISTVLTFDSPNDAELT